MKDIDGNEIEVGDRVYAVVAHDDYSSYTFCEGIVTKLDTRDTHKAFPVIVLFDRDDEKRGGMGNEIWFENNFLRVIKKGLSRNPIAALDQIIAEKNAQKI